MIRLVAFVLGFVSLGAEVSFAWACERLLGQTNATVAAVLSAWLLGLALGARVGGGSSFVAAKARSTVRRALLALGGLVILTRLALPLLAAVPAPADGGFPWARGFAVVLLLLPAPFAAGVAFPALVREAGVGRGRAGSVYAAETFGAVAGALVAGFLLVVLAGHLATALLLGALAAAVGSTALRRERSGPPAATPAEDPRSAGVAAPGTSALLAIGLAGAAALALELLWTRVLLFFVPGLTGALAAVLAGMLLGTSVGAAWGGARARRGGGRRSAATALVVGAAGVALALAILPHLADLVRAWPRPPGGGFRPGHELVVSFLVAVVVAFLPTAASGATFALLAGPRGAAAYAASCGGSVVGVLAAAALGGASVPLKTAIALAGVALAVASLLLRRPADGRLRPGLALGAIALVLAVPRDAPLLEQSVEFRKSFAAGRTVLAEEQDGHVVASVVDLGGGAGRALYTNAFLAASTQEGYGYMRMLGHLPALLARAPERALVIAYGTGTTVGSLALHPEVESIDVAEISPAVMRLAPWFQDVNRGVPYAETFEKAVRVMVADGRAVVDRRGPRYDVVTLEPLPPETPAAVHFYTREFYRAALARLAAGGVLCQWIPLHTSDPRSFRILLRTFALELPTTWLFLFDQCALLVGRPEPDATIPAARLIGRAGEIEDDLRLARMEDAAAVLGAYVADGPAILAATADVEAMSDDRPLVALRLARPARESLEDLAANARLLAGLEGDVTDRLVPGGATEEAAARFEREVRASARAKRLLREWRASVRDDPTRAAALLREALAERPADREARVALGLPPRDEDRAPPRRLDDAAVGAILERAAGGVADDDLPAALERGGLSEGVPARLLLPFLDHASLDIRMKAMVALSRRLDDLGGYDPLAPPPARRAVIRALEARGGEPRED